MADKIKDLQPEDKLLSQLDTIYLIKLYELLEKTDSLLGENKNLFDKVFSKLSIKAARIAEFKKSMGSLPSIWKFEDAKNFLDVIICDAALGKTIFIENGCWIVQVSAIKKQKTTNKT